MSYSHDQSLVKQKEKMDLLRNAMIEGERKIKRRVRRTGRNRSRPIKAGKTLLRSRDCVKQRGGKAREVPLRE